MREPTDLDTFDRCNINQLGHFAREIIEEDFTEGLKGWFLKGSENQTAVTRKHKVT